MTSRPFKSWRRFLVALAGVAVVLVTFGLMPQGVDFVKDTDRKLYDQALRSGGGPEERDDFVLLGIDEASLSMNIFSEEEVAASETLKLMGKRFPWDRRVWAEAIDRLCEAGAKLVILDLVFAEPGSPEEDDALAAAIARHPEKVVLTGVFSPIGQQEDGHLSFVFTEPYVQFLESDPEPRIGFANFWPDQEDSTIRSARYRTSVGKENQRELTGEPEVFSLAAHILDVYGVQVPAEDKTLRFTSQKLIVDGEVKANLMGNEAYKPRSVVEIFSNAYWETNYDGGRFFNDKVVMIGPVAQRFQDMHATPVGTLTGPQLHLQAAACGLAGAYVRYLGQPLWVMAAMGLIAVACAGLIERPRWSALVMLPLLTSYILCVWLLAKHQSILIPITGGLIAATVGWMTAQVYQLIRERMEKDRLRGAFRRFVSRDVADRLVDQPEAWRDIAAGRKRQVVVLFSDVREFTSRSEATEPTALVAQLNEYFSAMVAVVFRHGGTLDKFIGDAVMAHWGALDDKGDQLHARAALAAARDMHAELSLLNQRWLEEGREPFKMGVGIHLGEAVAAEIGSAERIEFGVIGDAVNLASRLEGLTKAFDCEVVFSDKVNEAAGATDGHALGVVRVKGRSAAVELFAYGDVAVIEQALAQFERDAEGAIVMKSK